MIPPDSKGQLTYPKWIHTHTHLFKGLRDPFQAAHLGPGMYHMVFDQDDEGLHRPRSYPQGAGAAKGVALKTDKDTGTTGRLVHMGC